MPAKPLRIRIQAWLHERIPLKELDALLAKKTVPLHDRYIWYCLGSMILVALTIQIVTGILLVVYYTPSAAGNSDIPGAYESIRQIVTELPHGWWIRSIHHWSAHLMIMAVLVHMLSALLFKAYRRPREVTWLTGLVLLCLTLTAGFTGYLLPWNSLSFAATRVGSGIAGATPLAGPLIRQLLLAGSDVGPQTLTRFFGLHVAVLPLLIVTTVGIHLVLVMYHGSSVPPAVERDKEAGHTLPVVGFWPEFTLREARGWLIVIAALLIVAFAFPPEAGEKTDPLVPTPEGIRPEWYFLAIFKMLKLLPTTTLGIENIRFGVLVVAVLGIVLVLLPWLDAPPGETAAERRRHMWSRRGLLLASFSLGTAATIAPLHLCLKTYGLQWWVPSSSRSAIAATETIVVLALVLIWLVVVTTLDRVAVQRPNAPATLFGVVLTSTLLGYTFWEALGAGAALVSLAILWVALLVIASSKCPSAGMRRNPARVTAGLLLTFIMLSTILLGRSPEHTPTDNLETPSVIETSAETNKAVPAARRIESAGRFGTAMAVCVFLLVAVHLRLGYQRRLREMGLLHKPA